MTGLNAEDLIGRLGLEAHPEGGHFREVYRHVPKDGGRGDQSSIYFLLRAGEVSVWHRVKDATEIWNFHAGAPLELRQSAAGSGVRTDLLGPDVGKGERPQIVVPAGHWQSARSLGDWTLVGCAVAPAFQFEGFEMAPADWEPAP